MLAERVAAGGSTVLILGETGTGKEIVARNIHFHSGRREKPFIPINCAAVPHDLLESELFGHERGSFTGAITTRKGKFELAEGGTLFLDEIGDMSLEIQAKLLRVLQEKRVDRIGASRGIDVDVRIIAATHRDLDLMVESGEFREDLFYRLNVIPIRMPPLRERREDIPLLLSELSSRLTARGLDAAPMSVEALNALLSYDWPGNVRELANVVERCANLVVGDEVRLSDLPQRIQRSLRGPSGDDVPHAFHRIQETCAELLGRENVELRNLLDFVEACLIRQALDDAGGVVSQAALLLGLRRSTLVDKIRKYGIEPHAAARLAES